MWTTAHIRRQLARMPDLKPFSIRDFLAFGARPAVDQAFNRLVKNGEVIRVARGIYIKANAPQPTVLEVALAKAAAFRRTIASHGSQAALLLKITRSSGQQALSEHVFATSGRSSSFRFGEKIIRFVGTSARKLLLADSKPGLAIRSLCYLGKQVCTTEIASAAIRSFGRSEHEQWKKHADLRPDWLNKVFLSISRYWEAQARQRRPWLDAFDPMLCPKLLRQQAFPEAPNC